MSEPKALNDAALMEYAANTIEALENERWSDDIIADAKEIAMLVAMLLSRAGAKRKLLDELEANLKDRSVDTEEGKASE